MPEWPFIQINRISTVTIEISLGGIGHPIPKVVKEVAMEGTNEADERLFHALGEAVGRIWSTLPQAVQQQIFEEAVMSQGEAMRQKLAVFLHDKHSRTLDSLKERAMPEPDSLGG